MQILRYTAVSAATVAILGAVESQSAGSFERNLAVSPPVSLEIDSRSGGITVRAGSPSAVRIVATIRARRSGDDLGQRIREIESNPPIQQQGSEIRILPVDEALGRDIAIHYEITVPAQTRLRARTGSGGVSVSGVTGPVDASTGSGGVTVAQAGGPVKAHTGSGGVQLTSIQGDIDAHTGSGGIDATGIAGAIAAQTGSGGLQLEQTTPGAVTARTGSGGVTLRLPAKGGFDLQARTGSGKVSVEPPITVSGTISGHQLQGKIRGGGPLVDVTTGSGSIRIQ